MDDHVEKAPETTVETPNRGLYNRFFGKKDEEKKPEEEVMAEEFDQKVTVSEPAPSQPEPVELVSEPVPQSEPNETTNHGLYDYFFGKKEEKKPGEEAMAEEFDQKVTVSEHAPSQPEPVVVVSERVPQPEPVETTNRGLYDYFFGNKDEEKKPEEEVMAKEFDQKVTVSEPAPPQSESVVVVEPVEPTDPTVHDNFFVKKEEEKKREAEVKTEEFDQKLTISEHVQPQPEPVVVVSDPMPQPESIETTDRGLYDRVLETKDEEKKPEAEVTAVEFDQKVTVTEPVVVGSEHAPQPETVETTDRSLYDRFLGKKDEEKKPKAEVTAEEFDQKVSVSEPAPRLEPEPVVVSEPVSQPEPVVVGEPHKEEEKKGSLLARFHRSNSSSSSSSDEEEVGEDGEKKKKKKKKKGLKEKISGEHEKKPEEDTSIPIEKVEEPVADHEKKGFMEKMKDKLHGTKKPDEAPLVITAPPAVVAEPHEGEAKEKKGIFKKIREKMHGYHSKTDEVKENEKDKEAPSH